jgi:hypothetical protein
MSIGAQGKTSLVIIILNIIQRNITNICAHLSYIRIIAYMLCEGVLNSRSPSRAHAQTHMQANAPCEPLRSEQPYRMHMLLYTRTGLQISYNFSNYMFITLYLLLL